MGHLALKDHPQTNYIPKEIIILSERFPMSIPNKQPSGIGIGSDMLVNVLPKANLRTFNHEIFERVSRTSFASPFNSLYYFLPQPRKRGLNESHSMQCQNSPQLVIVQPNLTEYIIEGGV